MDEILHHLRNPRMMIPCKYQFNLPTSTIHPCKSVKTARPHRPFRRCSASPGRCARWNDARRWRRSVQVALVLFPRHFASFGLWLDCLLPGLLVCLWVCLCVCLSSWFVLWFVCLFVCLFACLLCLVVCSVICLSFLLFIGLFVGWCVLGWLIGCLVGS